MPIIEIEGKGRVEVEDSFFDLSPEEQARQADEISAAMGDDLQASEPQGPKLNEDGYDTSGDSSYNIMQGETPDVGREENGQKYSTGGVPLGGNSNTQIVEDQTPEGMKAAPSGNLSEVLDEEGNLTSRAYDGLSYGDALKVYENIANHPDAEVTQSAIPGGPQTIFFRGHRVPVPEPEFFGDGAKVGSVQLGGDQILQTASNLMDLVSAGANKLAAATGGEENMPLINREGIEKEGIVDNVLAEGPVLAATGATGLRAANALVGGTVSKIAGSAGEARLAEGILKRYAGNIGGTKLIERAAIRGTGVNAAMVGGMDNDASGVFVGDDAMIPAGKQFIEVLSTDPKTRTPSAQVLANKVNLFADAVTTGLVASGVAGSATVAKKIFYDGIIKRIVTYGSDASQEQEVMKEFLGRLGNLSADATPAEYKAFAQEINNIISTNKDILARTPTGGGIDVELDPLAAVASALENSGSKADQIAGSRARTLRNDIYGANLPEPNIRQEGYQEELDNFGRGLYETGGGAEGVESARSGIVQSGRNEVAAARGAADSAQADVEKNADKIAQIFKMDGTIGQKLAKMEGEPVDINIYRKGNEATEKTVARIEAGERQLRGARDQAYKNLDDAIPEGVPIGDPQTFDTLMTDAGDSLPPSLIAKYQNMDINDYKSVRKEILPAVDRALNQTEPGTRQYQSLLDLKKNINTDQFNALDQGVKAQVQGAKDAVDEANRNYYNWFSKGPLKDVSDESRSVGVFRDTKMPNRSEELTAADTTSNTIDSLFSNGNRGGLQLVGEFLQTPEGGRSAKPLVDIGIAKIVQAARKTAQTKGVGGVDSQQLISSLGNFSAALEKVNPQQYQRLEGIITNLRKHEKNGVELERIAKEAEQLANDTESSVLDQELGDFFKNSGKARREITQGQQVFNGIFKDKKLFDQKVDDLIVRANQAGPEARNGLKAAFGNFIKFNEKEIAANGDQTLDIARRVYDDEPQVVEAIETAFRLTDMVRVGAGSRADIGAIGANVAQQGQGAINRAITLLFGVLNPTATKVRTITSIAAKDFDPKDNMIRLMGEIAVDTPRFQKLLDDFISKGMFSDTRRLFDFMVKAGIYSNTDEDYNSFAERLDMEQMNQSNTTNDDTDKAFGE